jgi:RNA polymerase sigma factor (sigma-70 family)
VEASRVRRPLRRLGAQGRPSERAFEQLYERHARDVYQYALAVLSNPADAEDVTQTPFLNAYRAIQKGERPQKPHNWLIAIAHNVCRMRWRQAGARPREVALDEAPELAVREEERPDLAEVLTALAELSFNQRAALVMRELEGRSYQEIAEVLGTTVSAVEALLFRARRRLQVNRKSIGAIAAVPLPGSLTSFIGAGAGGGAVAAGGTAVGADLALKAAAVVAAGAVTAGVGYRSVSAVAETHQAAAPPRAAHVVPRAHARNASSHGRATRTTEKRAPQRRATTHRRLATRPTTAAGAAPAPAAALSAQASPAATAAAPTAPGVTTPAVTTIPALPVTVPQLQPPPPVTVSVPTSPVLPPPPPVTVTVPTVPLPPLPPPVGK